MSIPLAQRCTTLYELYGGTFVRGTSQPLLALHPHPPQQAQHAEDQPRRTDGIYVVDLPSEVGELESASWERPLNLPLGAGGGGTVEDFTLDRAGDLWVGVGRVGEEYVIHLRTLSTGGEHPLARVGEIRHRRGRGYAPAPADADGDEDADADGNADGNGNAGEGNEDGNADAGEGNANADGNGNPEARTSYTMQLCGTSLGILFHYPPQPHPQPHPHPHPHAEPHPDPQPSQELLIWNWTTSTLRAQLTPADADLGEEEEMHSFSFLAEDVVMLAKTGVGEAGLEVVWVPEAAAGSGSAPSPGEGQPTARASAKATASARARARQWKPREAQKICTFRLPKLRREWTYTSIVTRSDPAPVARPFDTLPMPSGSDSGSDFVSGSGSGFGFASGSAAHFRSRSDSQSQSQSQSRYTPTSPGRSRAPPPLTPLTTPPPPSGD
ncbi:hypothetical protein DACRYDRAFT_110121, partial [Dacryopinax primogenitus]